jgi:hypothetical protein
VLVGGDSLGSTEEAGTKRKEQGSNSDDPYDPVQPGRLGCEGSRNVMESLEGTEDIRLVSWVSREEFLSTASLCFSYQMRQLA